MAFPTSIEVIIPFASSQVAKNWPEMCQMLQSTLTSILALQRDFVSVSILGHERPDKLPLGDRCYWTTVAWNPPHRDDAAGKLHDKGIKLRQGVQDAFERGVSWVMFVDGDDLISRRLPKLCDFQNHDAIVFEHGYSWDVGSAFLEYVPNFHRVCGTSWILRLSPQFFPTWLGDGSHRVCDLAHNERYTALQKNNARIQSIREPMAIYRLSQRTNTWHGTVSGIRLGSGLSNPLQSARRLIKKVIRRRKLTFNLRAEFAIPMD